MKKYLKPSLLVESFQLDEVILSSGLNVEDVHDIGENNVLDELF